MQNATRNAPPMRVPAFYRRRKKRAPELICQLLLSKGVITVDTLREGLRIQEEDGGQIGRILVRIGACSESALARALLEQLRLRAGADNVSTAARENPEIVGLRVPCSPFWTTTALVLTDLASLLLGAGFGEVANLLRVGTSRVGGLLLPLPAIAVCIAAFWALDLYAAMAPSAPDELRATTTAITLMSLGAGAVAVLAHGGTEILSISGICVWWAMSLLIVPLARAFLRDRCADRPWWGHPVVVLGAARTGRMLVHTLLSQPRCGLKPVMMLDDDRAKHGTLRAHLKDESLEVRSATHTERDHLLTDSVRARAADLVADSVRTQAAAAMQEGERTSTVAPISAPLVEALAAGVAAPSSRPPSSRPPSTSSRPPPNSNRPRSRSDRPRGMFAEVDGVPVVGDLALAPLLAKRLKIPYAVIAMPGAGAAKLLQITERVGGIFSHILVIPDLFGFASLGVPAKDVGGVLGIEVRQQLLLPLPRFVKRVMDVALTTLGGLLIVPFVLLLALLIKIDSRGPVFYFQERLGRNGARFRAAKFRTMHGDGEERLKAVLDNDPKLRAEYDEFHKLTNDPRVTRVGRVVRKYSLDELPQLWNVITGDMSLVGPRPYLEREIPDMEQRETIILRATPGVTGLWQVSDRNATGFRERVTMDVHYVRNWSPWLDVYILARTLGVVLRGTGV